MSKSIKLKDDNYWDSRGIVHNKTPLNNYIGYIRTANEHNKWYKLGTIKGFANQGACSFVKCLCGAGQNGKSQQNLIIDIMIKRGWEGEGVKQIFGATYTIFKMANTENLSDYKIKIIASNINDCDIWVKGAGTYSCIDYNVTGHFNQFIPSNDREDTEPSYGYSQQVQGGYIDWTGTL